MSDDLLTKLAESVRELFRRVGHLESLEDCCLAVNPSVVLHQITTAGLASGTEDVDVQAIFGAPEGISAVLVTITMCDSNSNGAAATTMYTTVFKKGEANPQRREVGRRYIPAGIANSQWMGYLCTVPVDSDGKITCAWVSSGVGTMSLYLRLAGYV